VNNFENGELEQGVIDKVLNYSICHNQLASLKPFSKTLSQLKIYFLFFSIIVARLLIAKNYLLVMDGMHDFTFIDH